MAGEVRDLESDLRKLAKDTRPERRATSQRLRETADAIDQDSLASNIELSAAAIDGPSKEASRRMESEIGLSLERIAKGIGAAAESVDESRDRKLARNLEQMRALVEGLESLERQMLQRSRGEGANASDPRGGWGAADGHSWTGRDFDPADIADFRRDFAERRGLLERLARVLTSEEHGARDIGELLDEMRDIERNEDFDDAQSAMRRQRKLIARLKELELRLKGDPSEEKTRALLLTGNDAVPPEYRSRVEEYFRDLSRAGGARRVAD